MYLKLTPYYDKQMTEVVGNLAQVPTILCLELKDKECNPQKVVLVKK